MSACWPWIEEHALPEEMGCPRAHQVGARLVIPGSDFTKKRIFRRLCRANSTPSTVWATAGALPAEIQKNVFSVCVLGTGEFQDFYVIAKGGDTWRAVHVSAQSIHYLRCTQTNI